MKNVWFIPLFCTLASGLSAQENNKSLFVEDFNTVYAFETLDSFTPIADGKSYIRMLNNSENLAIQVVAVDKTTQTMFVTNGLSLYIDISGGRSRRYALNFPKANMDQLMLITTLVPQDTENAEEILNMSIQRMAINLGQRQSSLQTPREIIELDRNSAGLYFDPSGMLVYTVELPLNRLGGNTGRLNTVNVGLQSQFNAEINVNPSMMNNINSGAGINLSSSMSNINPAAISTITISGDIISVTLKNVFELPSVTTMSSHLNTNEIINGMMVWVPFETN